MASSVRLVAPVMRRSLSYTPRARRLRRVPRGPAKSGANPALSRNCDAPTFIRGRARSPARVSTEGLPSEEGWFVRATLAEPDLLRSKAEVFYAVIETSAPLALLPVGIAGDTRERLRLRRCRRDATTPGPRAAPRADSLALPDRNRVCSRSGRGPGGRGGPGIQLPGGRAPDRAFGLPAEPGGACRLRSRSGGLLRRPRATRPRPTSWGRGCSCRRPGPAGGRLRPDWRAGAGDRARGRGPGGGRPR